MIRWGFLASSLSLLIIPLAGSLPALLLAVGLLSACTWVLIPAITSLTSTKADISQGVAVGLSNFFISLSRIFGPTLGGLVFDLHWNMPFAVGALLMGAAFAVSRDQEKSGGREPERGSGQRSSSWIIGGVFSVQAVRKIAISCR